MGNFDGSRCSPPAHPIIVDSDKIKKKIFQLEHQIVTAIQPSEMSPLRPRGIDCVIEEILWAQALLYNNSVTSRGSRANPSRVIVLLPLSKNIGQLFSQNSNQK